MSRFVNHSQTNCTREEQIGQSVFLTYFNVPPKTWNIIVPVIGIKNYIVLSTNFNIAENGDNQKLLCCIYCAAYYIGRYGSLPPSNR